MMFRTVLCVLALGATTAFQAPVRAAGRSTVLMSTNDLYQPAGSSPSSTRTSSTNNNMNSRSSSNRDSSDYGRKDNNNEFGRSIEEQPYSRRLSALQRKHKEMSGAQPDGLRSARRDRLYNKPVGSYGSTSTYGSSNTYGSRNTQNRRDQAMQQGAAGLDSAILVQGGSLRTWSYRSPNIDQVQVVLATEGRPLDADIELWHGPDNTPCKMRVYVENGQLRPFSALIETPRGPNTVAIRNIGQLEFPFAADVYAQDVEQPSDDCLASASTIQGGALRTYPFDTHVDSVQVLLKTDGRPLNARIELLQGPNNNKQVIELYTEDGFDRPFFCILETPGSGNVVRVVNTAPVEFPMAAAVVPHSINDRISTDAVLGGDVVIGGDMAGRW